ncbi:MAG: hypothetical protein DI556_01555 [Rhodovulum sulfidophilum]|uniref:Flagellar FliJ protein n=1 Tax=Rhodovulum sulfidophilum TaxID=35806 RepID=A0A2W5QLF4_RHOSU|nr:MAG: hypothetical protein DI556_01555 [Rhodovulum sulfidophilum]
MTPAALEALRRLAEARKAADLAALERLRAARRDCAAGVAAVLSTRAAELAAPLDSALAEALAARLRWADQRLAALRGELRALDQRIAEARAAAAVSLGKDRALGALGDAAARERARLRAARLERDAPPPGERRDDWE